MAWCMRAGSFLAVRVLQSLGCYLAERPPTLANRRVNAGTAAA